MCLRLAGLLTGPGVAPQRGVLHGRVVRLKQGVTGRLLRIGRVRSPDRTPSIVAGPALSTLMLSTNIPWCLPSNSAARTRALDVVFIPFPKASFSSNLITVSWVTSVRAALSS